MGEEEVQDSRLILGTKRSGGARHKRRAKVPSSTRAEHTRPALNAFASKKRLVQRPPRGM